MPSTLPPLQRLAGELGYEVGSSRCRAGRRALGKALTCWNGYSEAMVLHEQHLDVRRVIAAAALLAGIVEGSDDAIIAKNAEGIVISWNPAAERMFGYREDEAVGKHIGMLIPPDHHGEDLDILQQILDGKRVDHFETQRVTKDGRVLDVSLTVSPVKDVDGKIIGASKIVRDITEALAARRAHTQLAAIVENADDAIIAKDTHGVIISWNPAAQRMFGYSAEEAIGQPISMLMPPYMFGHERDILSEVLDGHKVDHYETQRIAKDGRVLDVSLSVSPLKEVDGTIVGASKIVRDITERKLFLERERHAAELAHTNEQLAAADRLKDQFLAMASHEMRTPLTAIAGFTSTMRSMPAELSEEQKQEFLTIIDTQVRRLQRLVDDLLTLTQIQSGALEARCETVPVALALKRTVRELAASSVAIACPDELTALADPDQLQQILTNYLGNAIKYGAEPIEVSARAAGGTIEIRVADHGDGVPEEFVPQLFQRFARASSSSADIKGTGLGLSISLGLAHAQGGDAWYEPNQPRGACFVVQLPTPMPPGVPEIPLAPAMR